MTVDVRRASATEIRPLRHSVLRPGQPAEDSVYPVDDDAVHVGAWDDGELVACATVFPEPYAGPPRVADAWRLRGMAVTPDRQGGGLGRMVLNVALAEARKAGASLVWANARSAAVGFYVREGWQTVGPEFVTPDTGLPHRRILRDVTNG